MKRRMNINLLLIITQMLKDMRIRIMYTVKTHTIQTEISRTMNLPKSQIDPKAIEVKEGDPEAEGIEGSIEAEGGEGITTKSIIKFND